MRADHVIIGYGARDYPLTAAILGQWPGVSATDLAESAVLPAYGPRTLYLAVHKGSFIKHFRDAGPAARHVVYQSGCWGRCSYCYLKSYLEHPHLVTVFVNRDALAAEITREVADDPGTVFYTGELTDSLLTDAVTGYGGFLVELFGGLPVKRFELRTKMTETGSVLSVHPPTNALLTWTLNPPEIAGPYEAGAAGVEERLDALVRCREHGYRVGFHLDPLIRITGWKDAYARLLQCVFRRIHADDLAVISIGTLRFKRELVEEMGMGRLAANPAFVDEFVPGEDGKFRYFKPIRRELYRGLLELMSAYMDPARVRIVMEPVISRTEIASGYA